jgi:hypothetical protein
MAHRRPGRAATKREKGSNSAPAKSVDEEVMRTISLLVAAVLSIVLSVWLELSSKGIAAITLLCVLVCMGIGEIIRAVRPPKPKNENKTDPSIGGD